MKRKILLLVVSVGVCLGIGEAVCRVLPRPLYFERVLFVTKPWLQVFTDKTVRFAVNRNVREVAVYEGKIEYDIRYKTNNLGFVSRRNYFVNPKEGTGEKNYFLVGDSFTAGSGYGDWVSELQGRAHNKDPNIFIYNIGVPGSGFVNFYLLLKSLSKHVPLKHIYILGISDDFVRGPWRPFYAADGLRFCPYAFSDDECVQLRPPTAYYIEPETSRDEIMTKADAVFKKIRKQDEPEWFVPKPYSYSALLSRIHFFLNYERSFYPAEKRYKLLEQVLHILGNIRKDFADSDIHFLHIPQKNEVINGEYAISIENRIENLGIKYHPLLTERSWSRNMYHDRDDHPNVQGYRAISAYVEDAIL